MFWWRLICWSGLLDRLSGESLHKQNKKNPRQLEKAACTLQMLVYFAFFPDKVSPPPPPNFGSTQTLPASACRSMIGSRSRYQWKENLRKLNQSREYHFIRESWLINKDNSDEDASMGSDTGNSKTSNSKLCFWVVKTRCFQLHFLYLV